MPLELSGADSLTVDLKNMRFLSLDLNLLRVFDAVMTEQNLTRAANRLSVTQPAVSNALKRLRDTVGDDLLIRTAYGVKPTPRAEALWPAVRRALSDLEAALIPEAFDVKTAHQTFHMAMADATAALWLPSLVRSFEREAPGLEARMVPLTTREPRPMLMRGDIDLAVGFFPGVVAQMEGGQGGGIADSAPAPAFRHIRLRDAARPSAGKIRTDAGCLLCSQAFAGELFRPRAWTGR